jgi:hypothetical protein
MVLFMVVGPSGQNGRTVYVGINTEREHVQILLLKMGDYLVLIPTWSMCCVNQPDGMVSEYCFLCNTYI